jgi:hypothetical protein
MFFVFMTMSISTQFDQAYQAWKASVSSPMSDLQGYIALLEYRSEQGDTDPQIDLFLDYVEAQIESDPLWSKNYAS